jgi:DNA (cytosine-5)-methyltransferase 1
MDIPKKLLTEHPSEIWHKSSLIQAYGTLPNEVRKKALWWRMPFPDEPVLRLKDVLEDQPHGVKWHTAAETESLLAMMSPANCQKVREAQALGKRIVGTLYKRTRHDENGDKTQRAEVRFDQISGCLRTPAGGSSRQTILIVEGTHVRSRLLSPREAARLMGAPDSYPLPANYNDAYKLMGDGLVVPVVSWLNEHILTPLAQTAVRRAARKVA